jgi:hypothetical protein
MEKNSKNKMNQILAAPIGVTLLALSIIISRFFPSTAFWDFLSGFLLGLSLVLNVYYIIITTKNLRSKKE